MDLSNFNYQTASPEDVSDKEKDYQHLYQTTKQQFWASHVRLWRCTNVPLLVILFLFVLPFTTICFSIFACATRDSCSSPITDLHHGESRKFATPKRWRFVRGHDTPIHGSCAIYFPGGIYIAVIMPHVSYHGNSNKVFGTCC